MSNVCDICMENFSKKYLLILHKRIHSDENKCFYCKHHFKSADDFSRHLQNHINRQKIVQVQCGSCLKRFNKNDELVAHFEGHCHGLKTMENGFEVRAVKAIEVNNYICKICDKAYLRSDLCKLHLSKHVSDLRCNLCGKGFTKYEHLLNHTRAHTNELPLQCTQCAQSFYKKEHLTRHIRTHSEEASFICDFCGKSFGRKDNLIRHIRCHSKKSVKCTICRIQFNSNLNFAAHMRSHTKNRAFQCRHCNKSFVTAGNLEFHEKTHKSQVTLELQVEPL